MFTNKVGLEVEFFVLNEKNELVIPSKYGFDIDEFILLGEMRAEPGETRADTLSLFWGKWYNILLKARKEKLIIDIETGYKEIDPKFYAQVLREMGNKEISASKNIHNIDLLELTDAVVENGKLLMQRISNGLHIHFSSSETVEKTFKTEKFVPVSLPLSITGALTTIDLYKKIGDVEEKVTACANRITVPVLHRIIEDFDKEILPKYVPNIPLKFRNPGFYEMKYHGGFEYRSMPFTQKVLDNLFDIVDYAFLKLEQLDEIPN
jgi:hypothetical protein